MWVVLFGGLAKKPTSGGRVRNVDIRNMGRGVADCITLCNSLRYRQLEGGAIPDRWIGK